MAARERLNKDITQKEVEKAINQLKNDRAAGINRIIGEIMKEGGEILTQAVGKMCCEAWRLEQVPRDWMQGVIFPLYKEGDNRDPLNYRGITLLSIVGKVYNRVLTERLVRFAERQGGIVEEQGGFRPERGTDDQLFVLTEILRSRGSRRTTYTAFIDVKKAYDTVWRNGLWKRLWDEGIRGKMWRVVKGMYGVVQSAVLVGDEQTEWFDLSTGVRQGCVMSPILFSLFINGLAREINEKGKGVDIGGRRVRLLMYADDIVLLAESARDLQNMLEVVTAYSKRWRFRLNPKKGKSEVMIFGRKPRNKDRKWWLAGEEIGETCMYKYLGIELRSGLSFKHYKDKIVTEARKRMMQVWAMGMRVHVGSRGLCESMASIS